MKPENTFAASSVDWPTTTSRAMWQYPNCENWYRYSFREPRDRTNATMPA